MERLWRFRFVRVVFMEVWAEGKRSWEGDRGGDMEGDVVFEWEVEGCGIRYGESQALAAPHLYIMRGRAIIFPPIHVFLNITM